MLSTAAPPDAIDAREGGPLTQPFGHVCGRREGDGETRRAVGQRSERRSPLSGRRAEGTRPRDRCAFTDPSANALSFVDVTASDSAVTRHSGPVTDMRCAAMEQVSWRHPVPRGGGAAHGM
jgi:hypothetical protein